MRNTRTRSLLPNLHSSNAEKLSLYNYRRSSADHYLSHHIVDDQSGPEQSSKCAVDVRKIEIHFTFVTLLAHYNRINISLTLKVGVQTPVIADVFIHTFSLILFVALLVPSFHDDVSNSWRPYVFCFLATFSQICAGERIECLISSPDPLEIAFTPLNT